MLNTTAIITLSFITLVSFLTMIEIGNNGIIVVSFNKKEYKVNLKYIIIMLVFFLYGIFVKDSYDLSNYRLFFEERIAFDKEVLYDMCQFFFHDRSFSFNLFRGIWHFVIVVLLFVGIKRFSKKPEQVVALTFFLALGGFITQMRSAMAFAIILNCIPLLFTGKVRDRIIYGLLVILCGQMHIASYLFLILLFSKKGKQRGVMIFSVLCIIAGVTMLLGANRYLAEALNVLAEKIPMLSGFFWRVADSIDYLTTPIKLAVFITCKHVFLFVFTYIACRIQFKETGDSKYEYINGINILSLILLPICFINVSFIRVYNPIMLIQFGTILNVGSEKIGLSDFIKLPEKMNTSILTKLRIPIKWVMFCFAAFAYFAEVKGSPEDYIRLWNSIRFF